MSSTAKRGAAVEAIRTIKFPLAPALGHSNMEALARACRADALSIFGALNFSDWLEQQDSSFPTTYSLLDFWIDSLAIGGVFQPTKDQLGELASIVSGKDQVAMFAERARECVREDLRDLLDYRALYWFARKNQRSTSGPAKIKQVFKEPAKKETLAIVEEIVRAYGELSSMTTKIPPKERARAKLSLFADVGDDLLSTVCGAEKGDRKESDDTAKDLDLTFLVVPVLPSYPLPDIKQLLSVTRGERVNAILAGWEERKGLFGEAYTPLALLGLSDSFNALSNFGNKFLAVLREPDGVEHIASAMERRLKCAPEHQGELRVRLRILQERSKWLRPELSLMSSYSDYRQELGGKLASWFSNRQNYLENIRGDLEKSKDILATRIAELGKRGNGVELVASSKMQLDLTTGILQKATSSAEMFSPEVRTAYQELLHINALGETAWNEYCLKHQDEEEGRRRSKKAKQEGRKGEGRRITLPKFPSFFGDERRAKYLKFIESPRILEQALSEICALLRSDLVPAHFDEAAEEDAKAAQRVLAGTRRLVAAYGRDGGFVCSARVAELFAKLKEPKGYYKHPNSRRVIDKLPVPSHEDFLQALRELSCSTADILQAWDKDIQTPIGLRVVKAAALLAGTLISIRFNSSQGRAALLAAIERVVALKVRNSGVPAFPSLVPLVGLRRAPEERAVFVDQALGRTLSEISGIVSLLSRQTIVERYAIQAENGKQTDVYVGNAATPERAKFAVEFPKWRGGEAETLNEEYPLLFIRANNKLAELTASKKPRALYPIRSSKYQVQFLRWSLKRPATKSCEAMPGGSFLIAERRVQLTVTKERVQVIPGHDGARCYVSIPFTLKPVRTEVLAKGMSPEREEALDPNLVIGIDVGEYALAYSVVRRSITDEGASYRVVESGVIADGTHRVLRDRVARLQRRQRTGVFASPDTSVAGARETLVGSYTNKLHRLVLRYRARLVFELDISAFEAGGNRIKTVYNSVKRADCASKAGTDADTARRRHVWGIQSPRSGVEVSANGTSQTCACCRWWFRDFLDEQEDSEVKAALAAATVRERNGHYEAHEVSLKGRRLSFFLPRSKRDAAGRLSVDELHAAIRAYMRPPLWRLGKGVLPKNARRRRGNSAVYRCPFVNCGHVADADVQASFNIAARAFLTGAADYKVWQDWRQPYREARTAPPGLERRFFSGESYNSQANASVAPLAAVQPT
jgi:hypothetical protein